MGSANTRASSTPKVCGSVDALVMVAFIAFSSRPVWSVVTER
jgi:hypothetical protein